MGHARALRGVKDRETLLKLAKRAVKEGVSVRQLEDWVQQVNEGVKRTQKKKVRSQTPLRPEFKRYEDVLQEAYSTPVRIRHGRKKGRIEIEYYSERELERLVEMLQKDRILD